MAEAVRRYFSMADARDNFRGALYDMFGVGSASNSVEKKVSPVKNFKSSNEPPVTPPKPVIPVQEKREPVKPEPVIPTPEPVPAVKLNTNKTYLAPGTSFRGDLYSDGDVEIAGEFEGNIISKGVVVLRVSLTGNITAAELQLDHCHLDGDISVAESMIIGDGSYVKGNISAKDAVVLGKVDGNIIARESIDLRSTAVVNGDLTAKILSCARNARLIGRLTISPDTSTEKPAVEATVLTKTEPKAAPKAESKAETPAEMSAALAIEE